MNVALALARHGLRVGLATVLADDAFGRTSLEKIAAAKVDVGGVALARPRAGFVLVDSSGGARQVPSFAEEEAPLEVPAGWSSPIMVLSGLSPVVSHAAALCKVARASRRDGALVLIDFNASLHIWVGRDPRTIRMVLREVDVARCSFADLAVLGMDVATVRAALRPTAVLVVSDGIGGAVATGPFGEVALAPRGASPHQTGRETPSPRPSAPSCSAPQSRARARARCGTARSDVEAPPPTLGRGLAEEMGPPRGSRAEVHDVGRGDLQGPGRIAGAPAHEGRPLHRPELPGDGIVFTGSDLRSDREGAPQGKSGSPSVIQSVASKTIGRIWSLELPLSSPS